MLAGDNVSFAAAANGTPTPAVQWQMSTDGGTAFSDLNGATSTNLTFPTTPAQNGNRYRALFSNAAGSATTSMALLTVMSTAPAITTAPTDQTFVAGNSVTLTAAASGAPTPTVQWQVSTDGGASFTNLSGATSTTLTFSPTLAQNGNRYRAVFTNAAGSATTATVTLVLATAPAVVTNPTNQTVLAGGNTSFAASANGTPAPAVQWQVSTDGGSTFSDVSGATSTTLTFSTTPAQNGNRFRAVFSNVAGSVATASATLTVTAAPPLVTSNPTSQTVAGGNTATFTAAASGAPTPTVQWQVSTNGGASFTNLSGATATTLTFVTTLGLSANRYRAVFNNGIGSATTTAAVLTVTVAGTSLPPIADPTGSVQTFTSDPSGQLDTNNPFFQNLGANGRTCATCHQQGEGWSVSAANVQARFDATSGTDPIFQTVDGSNCDHNVDVSTLSGRTSAFGLLTSRGLIRIFMPVPAGAEFSVTGVSNQYGCNEFSPLSMYRRPLPTANLRFLTTLMWDGRESAVQTGTQGIALATNPNDLLSDLAHQSVSATLTHAQASTAPTSAQQQAIVNFQMQLSVAQTSDSIAGSLQADGSVGGPAKIASQPFTIGVNDPFTPTGPPFTSSVWSLFNPWVNFPTGTAAGAQKASIARGQTVFNTKPVLITGVAGLNDVFFAGGPTLQSCGYCHDTPNVGGPSLHRPMNIGVADPTNPLGVGYLPVITLRNNNTNATVQTTDPGVALVTGKWSDVGKVKVPMLRALASRAPYFHNGSAKTLSEVLTFYEFRFGVSFTAQERADLIAFLNSL